MVLQIPNDVVGAAVTFLLVFRVNTGYERWWEGRRTFREVVNHSRDFARQVATHVSDFYHAEKMIRWVMVSVLMLKQHLREESFVDEVSPRTDERRPDYFRIPISGQMIRAMLELDVCDLW